MMNTVCSTKAERRKHMIRAVWNSKYIYLLLLPYLVWIFMFDYVPMGGLVLAFKEYNAADGMFLSPWVGFKHFERLFQNPKALSAIWNSIVLSLQRILFEFPVPIILAIITTEMRGKKIKKVFQTILTFPHFLSWVMISSMLTSLFAESGAINSVINALGGESIPFLSNGGFFRAMLFVTSNWKNMGWSAIIYMATISSIDTSLYEAAEMDGASRLQQIRHITLPALLPLISLQLIMKMRTILGGGFDQIYNMRNNVVRDSVRILDSYIHDITFNSRPDYGFSTAVGLFKGVTGFAITLLVNELVGKLTGEKMISFENNKKKEKRKK